MHIIYDKNIASICFVFHCCQSQICVWFHVQCIYIDQIVYHIFFKCSFNNDAICDSFVFCFFSILVQVAISKRVKFFNWCWMIANWKLKPITPLTTCPILWLGLVENFCISFHKRSFFYIDIFYKIDNYSVCARIIEHIW